jgi:hypothetical protein
MVSGRLKKGAQRIIAGSTICTVNITTTETVPTIPTIPTAPTFCLESGDSVSASTSVPAPASTPTSAPPTHTHTNTIRLKCPVGGRLLELNDRLLSSPHLLGFKHYSDGYVAVLLPDTEIPSLDVYRDFDALMASYQVCSRILYNRILHTHALHIYIRTHTYIRTPHTHSHTQYTI